MPRVERETAARISEEIGNLMKEIETLVEEKAKESAEMSKFIREGVGSSRSRCQHKVPQHRPQSHPYSFLIPPVLQVAPWCMREPASP